MTFLHKLAQRLARMKTLCAVPVVALIACEKPVLLTGPGGPGAVTRLIISPKDLTLLPNQTTDLMAVGLTATSDTGSVAVVWSVTGGTIVDTSASGGKHYGRYKSGAPGQYKVVANGNPGGLSDTATVTVNPVPVAAVVVIPAAPSVTVGQTVQLVATPQDSNGTALPGRSVTWASSNGAVATVSGGGLVTALAAGSATMTATSEGRSGTASISVANVPVATVTVSPASASMSVGQAAQLVGTAKDAAGNILSGRAITWASSNSSVATVSNGGLVTGVVAGSATITAASEGKTGTAAISVANVPVATVSVSPATASLAPGATQQLSATPQDANGNPLSGRPVTWISNNSAVAQVSGTGLVTAVAAGSATVTATSEGKSGGATITVTAPPPPPPLPPSAVTDLALAGVTDTSATLTFTEVNDGTGQPASYDVRYAAGTISWGSATEVSRGSCTTPVAGTTVGTRHTCTVLGLASSTAYGFQLVAFRGTLGVNPVFGALSNAASGTTAAGAPKPVASVTLSPTSASISIGGTQQFTATLRDASGTVLSGRTISWTSSLSNVATASGSGLVTALLAGTTTITATSEGKSGTATVTVTALPPPPPPGGWTNEPTGATVVSDYGFNDAFPVTQADVSIPGGSGWNSVYNGNGYMTRASDPTAPLSPSNVVQFLYPIGFPGTMGPATAWRPLPGLTRAYVGQWWKVSNPWQGNASSVNKIGYLVVNAGSMFLAMYGRWMDGQLIGSYTGVPMPTGGFVEYHLDPVWGGCCDTKTANDYYWFDHIHISGN